MSSAVDDEDIIEVLSESDDVELTTTAVADELPISRGYTRTRLQRLVEDGRLERRREGNSIVWWLPDRADDVDATEADDDEAGEDADDAADEEEAAAEDDVETEDEAAADEADEGPQSVEVEAVASEDDEGGAEEESTAGDEDAADEADEKPATATGTETPASAPEAGSDGESGDSVGPDERPTVRVREHGAPTSRGGPDSLAKLLGVAALVLLVFALLRRLRRR